MASRSGNSSRASSSHPSTRHNSDQSDGENDDQAMSYQIPGAPRQRRSQRESASLHDLEFMQAVEEIASSMATQRPRNSSNLGALPEADGNASSRSLNHGQEHDGSHDAQDPLATSTRPSSNMLNVTSSHAHLRFLDNSSNDNNTNPSSRLLDDDQSSTSAYSEYSEYEEDDFDPQWHARQNQQAALLGRAAVGGITTSNVLPASTAKTEETRSILSDVKSSTTSSTASSNIFSNRKDLREVDQSVNLMDPSKAEYGDNSNRGTKGRVARKARAKKSTNENAGFLTMGNTSLVDIGLDNSDSKLPSSFRRMLSRNKNGSARGVGGNSTLPTHTHQRRLFYHHGMPTPPASIQEHDWCSTEWLMENLCKFLIIAFMMTFVIILSTPQGTYWIQEQLGLAGHGGASGGGSSSSSSSSNNNNNNNNNNPFNIPVLSPSTSSAPDVAGLADPIHDRLGSLQNMILTHKLTDKEDLLRSNSPQQVASNWLAYEDPAELPMLVSDDEIIDTNTLLHRYAMATFYISMGGPKYDEETDEPLWNETHWHENENWMTSGEHICEWWGVDCEDGSHVVHFNLTHNHLKGSLPSELVVLTDLILLDMGYNQISGTLPGWVDRWTYLEYLLLKQNRFTGSLPASFGNMTNLQEFEVSHNHFTGSLPSELNKLTELQVLFLDHNDFGGSIPHLGDLAASLEYFSIYNNHFNDLIPHDIFRLTKLVELQLDNNELKGTIPPEMESILPLEHFSICNNHMSGTLPDIFDRLTNLVAVEVNNNKIRGSIPATMGNLTNLQTLSLDNNPITGTVPPALANLESAHTIRLFNTELTGSLPEEICGLKGLDRLEILMADCESGDFQCECCDRCY